MSLGNKMFQGMLWSAFERISVQAVTFVLTIILARLITPEEYGTIGILIVFISFSQVFIDSGFGKALIQKQDRSNEDISTVFWFNMLISIVLYFVLWLGAPFVASFYKIASLSSLLRVLSISLIFNALFAIPYTLYTIKMDFKSIARVNLIATVISGGIAIYLAYVGYGVWALVAQTIIKSGLMALAMWLQLKWRPDTVFSMESLKSLFSYGSKLLASSLLNNIVNNFYALFIAKLISTKELGFYTRGTQFADTFFSTISTIFDNVLLPGLSTVQDQNEVLVKHTRSIIRTASMLVAPLFLGLSVLAEPLVRLLLTEKWMMAVPIMQLICIARMITIISGINVNLLYVLGRTDLALKQQYLKIIVRVILLIVALPFGIVYIALAELIATAIHFFINTHYPGKIMKYGSIKQIKDILPIFIAAIIMTAIVYAYMQWLTSDIALLCTAPIIGAFVYYVLLKLFKVKELDVLVDRIQKLRSNRKTNIGKNN